MYNPMEVKMDGFIKKSLSKMLLSLFLIASTQNLKAMNAPGHQAQQQPPQPVVVVNNNNNALPVPAAVINNVVNAPAVINQAAVQPRPAQVTRWPLAKAALNNLLWVVKYPFKRIPSAFIHLTKTMKELTLTALQIAQLIGYFYMLDTALYYMAPAVTDFTSFIHLSQWSPECLKAFYACATSYYKAGDLSTFINSTAYKICDMYKAGILFSPTKLFCPAPTICSKPIVCPTSPTCHNYFSIFGFGL
jgi:hypothetical protein